MCGRFALGLVHRNVREMVAQAYPDEDIAEWINEEEFIPRYNIAPRTQNPVIRRRRAGEERLNASQPEDDSRGEVVMHTMKWGLVPHWSKHEDKTLSTTNARAENLVEGGRMWDTIKARKRCIVVCQGYYEWLKKDKEKRPHFTKHKDGKVMLLAGLYDRVVLEGETNALWTFTIVTTEANKDFQWLHDRQPVILSNAADVSMWLDTSSQKWTRELATLLLPYHDESRPLECYAVPQEVGKVGNESSSFIEPISQRKDGIEVMFIKQNQIKISSPTKSQSNISSPSSQKRKHSMSPILKQVGSPIDLTSDDEEKPLRKKSAISTQNPNSTQSSVGTTSNLSTSKSKGSESISKRKVSKTKTNKNEKSDPSEMKITRFFTKT